MKYLAVAALVALLLILIYSRLRPYLLILKKVLGTLNAVAGSSATAERTNTQSSTPVKSKLIKCIGCGTWVPADRAIGSRVGGATFCSRECLEKSSNSKERKMAG